MKYRSNIPKYSEFVFENVDSSFAGRAQTIKKDGKQNIIVAGLSYGQGSSREHAALCPMYLGVRAVIAKSFERIHAANLINFGILPLIFSIGSDYDKIDQGDDLEIVEARKIIAGNGKLLVQNKTKGIFVLRNLRFVRKAKTNYPGGRRPQHQQLKAHTPAASCGLIRLTGFNALCFRNWSLIEGAVIFLWQKR